MPDRAKRIHAVAVGMQDGTPLILLLLDGDDAIVAEHESLTENEADVFGHGVRAGLLWAGPREVAGVADKAMVAPEADTTAPHASLFHEGVREGLRIAANGYWLDEDGPVPTRVLH